MRYGLIAENHTEEAFLRAAPQAATLLDPFLPALLSHGLHAFVSLGLPEALRDGPRSAGELAELLHLDPILLRQLSRVLTAVGYLERCGVPGADERFSLTDQSRATLLQDAPAALDAWVEHNLLHHRLFAELEVGLRGSRDAGTDHQPPCWPTYQRAMLQTARPMAQRVADAMPAPRGRGRLLDVGGGHGLYGAAIARRLPPMRVEVLDLPEAIPHAEAMGRQEGLDDVVDYHPADLRRHDLGEASCDLLFLGNILHHVAAGEVSPFLRRVHRALRPGGVVALWDMASAPGGAAELDMVEEGFALLFALSSGSAPMTAADYEQALDDAGFRETALAPSLSPTHILATGRR